MPIPKPIRNSLKPYEEFPLQDYLTNTANRLPDKIAIIDEDRKFTFKEISETSDRLASGLVELNVQKGDRIGLLSPNCAEFAIAFFGILKAGATVSTINSGYREREIAHQLNNSGAQILIVHHSLVPMAEAARNDIPALQKLLVITEDPKEELSFWKIIKTAPAGMPMVSINCKSDLAALPYSSGTTGLPKGVMLTHHNLTSNVKQCFQRPGEAATCTEQDVILDFLPLFHIYGMTILMAQAIAVGATQVMMGRFNMETFLSLISEHRVTGLYAVPPVGLNLIQYPNLSNYDLSSLRWIVFGAAPMSTDTQKRISKVLNVPVAQAYGLTETSPLTNHDNIDANKARPGSIGPASADTETKVVDLSDGESELPFGEIGELLVRGPQVMKGYFRNEEATAETITSDGWLHTGDMVQMDEDGYVWIMDRKKELIKYKGFQVPPAELEGLLLEHPAVSDAAVIGKENLESGEIPKAFIVKTTAHDTNEEELMAFVASKVATFKHVREIEFVESIPKNPSGKILRRILVEQERSKNTT